MKLSDILWALVKACLCVFLCVWLCVICRQIHRPAACMCVCVRAMIHGCVVLRVSTFVAPKMLQLMLSKRRRETCLGKRINLMQCSAAWPTSAYPNSSMPAHYYNTRTRSIDSGIWQHNTEVYIALRAVITRKKNTHTHIKRKTEIFARVVLGALLFLSMLLFSPDFNLCDCRIQSSMWTAYALQKGLPHTHPSLR